MDNPPLRLQLDCALQEVGIGNYERLAIEGMTRPHWVLSHVRHGHVRTQTRGLEFWAEAGDIMVHPPHLPFSEASERPGTHEYLMLDLTQTPQVEMLRLHPVSLVVRLPNPETFSQVFARLSVCWQQPASPVRDLQTFALTLELVALVLEGWQRMGCPLRPPAAQTPPDRFAALIAYVEAHLDQRITREDLAARVFLHPGYFDRIFRHTYGVAPLQMLRELRLSRARRLLETTAEPLEAIAAACGLGDPAAFSRAFRARYGVPPGRYRESAKTTTQSYLPP